jgi:hypothetical protein
MKPRFSIRTLIAATAAVACAIGWYASNLTERSREIRALDLMQQASRNAIAVVDSVSALPRVTPARSTILLRDESPWFLRSFQLDAFKRVVAVELYHETNVELLSFFPAFHDLESVSIDYDAKYFLTHPMRMEGEILRLIGAIRLYVALYPDINVEYPDARSEVSSDEASDMMET